MAIDSVDQVDDVEQAEMSAAGIPAGTVPVLLSFAYDGSLGAITAPVVTLTDATTGQGVGPVQAQFVPGTGNGGTLAASVTLPAGAALGDAGTVLWQAMIGGILTTLTVQTITLKNQPASPLDLDFVCGPALTQIAENSSQITAGSDGFLHLLLSATDSTLGTPVDLTPYPIQLALTAAHPVPADWQPATWLSRTAPPAGSYATLPVGQDHGLPLAAGTYWLYARVTVAAEIYVLKSPAPVVVRS